MQHVIIHNVTRIFYLIKKRFSNRVAVLLFLMVIIPFLYTLLSSPQMVHAADSAGKLIISPDAVSQPDVKVSGNDKIKSNYIKWSGKTADLNQWDAWLNDKSTYYKFVPKAGMTGIAFTGVGTNNGTQNPAGSSIPGEIKLTYSNVGFYNFSTSDNPNLQQIGATVTISNVVYGSQPESVNIYV